MDNTSSDPQVRGRSNRWLMILGIAFGSILGITTSATALFGLLSVRHYTVPSGSNEPTLLVGDYMLGLCYDRLCRLGTLAFLPEYSFGEPQVGDLVTFRKPSDESIDYVKRIVGAGGDTVQMRDGILYLNAKPVPKVRIADFIESGRDGKPHAVDQYEETLPNGVRYRVLDRTPDGTLDSTPLFTVPPGHFFMMGDNRDNSSDSRDPDGGVGYVPRSNLATRVRWITISGHDPSRSFTPVDLPAETGD